jgi:hypothetical protein
MSDAPIAAMVFPESHVAKPPNIGRFSAQSFIAGLL